MTVMLCLEGFQSIEPEVGFWRDEVKLWQLVEGLEANGLWLGFSHLGELGQPSLDRLESRDHLVRELATREESSFEVSCGPDTDQPAVLKVRFPPYGLELVLTMRPDHPDFSDPTLLDRFIAFTCHLAKSFEGVALAGPRLQVDVWDHEYPRVRPPRDHLCFELGTVVQFASEAFHGQYGNGYPADLSRMLAAPLPAGARREERAGLVIWRWCDHLADAERLAVARSAQERWLTSVLDIPIDASYNELGDCLAGPFGGAGHPLLTFYSTSSGIGVKAIFADDEGRVDEEQTSQLAGWIAAGHLPDDQPLNKLHLIVPSRDAALAVRRQATAIGVDRVLYTGEIGHLWDPFPPGLWLE